MRGLHSQQQKLKKHDTQQLKHFINIFLIRINLIYKLFSLFFVI